MLPAPPSLRRARRPHRRRLTAAALAALVSLAPAACGGGDGDAESDVSTESEVSDGPDEVAGTASAVQLNGVWPLTGEALEGDLPSHPAYAVKIDNTAGSAPQIGLSSADMIVEELVEGGLTRLAAFYYTTVPTVVGPVRSMRASDIGILKPVDATMIASGGAPITAKRIAAAQIATVRETTEGATGFYRDESRAAPYNLFVKLTQTAANPGRNWVPPSDPYLPFGDESDFSGTVPVRTVEAKFSDSHTTSWVYSGNGWTRPTSYTQPQDDFIADNLLLLRVEVGDAGYVDPGGYRVPETFFFGTGDAVLVHGDKALKCVWSKKHKGSPLQLSTTAGDDVIVPAGNTWIELVPTKQGQVTLGK